MSHLVDSCLKDDHETSFVRLGEQFNPQYIVDTLTFTRRGPAQHAATLLTMRQLKVVDAGKRCPVNTQMVEFYRLVSNPLPQNTGNIGNKNTR